MRRRLRVAPVIAFGEWHWESGIWLGTALITGDSNRGEAGLLVEKIWCVSGKDLA